MSDDELSGLPELPELPETVFDDEAYADDAAEVYRELLSRVGESAPQPRLDATRRAVELLGDPHRAAPVIHIAGTNGKTSTSRMIESILRATGLRTGLLTSPHLLKVNERIVLDGLPVSDEALVRNWADIAPYLVMVDTELVSAGDEPLTYFEALTVLAFAIFADAPADVVVLETGMGGEWDSTNVADGQVAVFTPIALDHESRLGSTVAEIARTKAGIVKPAAAVVTAIQAIEALDQISAAVARDEARLSVERRDFAVESTTVAVGGQLVSVRGLAAGYRDVYLPLYGDHQAQNAALAIAAVESFLGDGTIPLDPGVLAEGLGTVSSPGRLQLVGVEPTVLVDAAHNPHGATALAAALTEYFDFDEFAIVLGVLADKDVHGIVEALAPVATRFVVTRSGSDRAIAVDELARRVSAVVGREAVASIGGLDLALDAARSWAAESPRRAVVVAGSITLVGEAMALAETGGWK